MLGDSLYLMWILLGVFLILFIVCGIETLRSNSKNNSNKIDAITFFSGTAGISGSFAALFVAIMLVRADREETKAKENSFSTAAVSAMQHELLLLTSSLQMILKAEINLQNESITRQEFDVFENGATIGRPVFESIRSRIIDLPANIRAVVIQQDARLEKALITANTIAKNRENKSKDDIVLARINAMQASAYYIAALASVTTGQYVDPTCVVAQIDDASAYKVIGDDEALERPPNCPKLPVPVPQYPKY